MTSVTPIAGCVESLVGLHVGLLEDVQRVPNEPDDAPVAVYAGRLSNTGALGSNEAPIVASGAALAPEPALAACLGEAVERYAAAWLPPGRLVHACAGELSDHVVTPDQFALFSARQYRFPKRHFPFVRWRPRDRLRWVEGYSLVDGRPVWLPAVFVFQPYEPAPGEPLIAPCLSTGLACSTSRSGATVAGLCEVIERDALALAWLGKLQPAAIEPPTVATERVSEFIRQLDSHGFCWRVFDLTSDLGVPTAAAIIEGHSPVGWIVALGSACHPDPMRAYVKALVEAAHCRMYVKSLVRERPAWRAGLRFANVTSFAHHARFYSTYPQYRRAVDRWRSGTSLVVWNWQDEAIAMDEVWLRRQATRLSAAGYHAVAVELTPPDVAELGLEVVRVVIPGLQPLHGHHAWRHLGGARLRQLTQVFGSGTRQPWRYNAYPHPFP